MRRELISQYISDAAKHLIKEHHQNYKDVSQKLNLSYGFFRQLMSNNRALTTTDIYDIARIERAPISNLFPPIKVTKRNFKKYQIVTGDSSYNNFRKFMKAIRI